MISVELACIGREEFVGTMRRSSQVAWLLLGGARKTKIAPKLYLTIGTGPEKKQIDHAGKYVFQKSAQVQSRILENADFPQKMHWNWDGNKNIQTF